jgi:hypothetical protein
MEWAKSQQSEKLAWENCPRGDWLLWIAGKVAIDRKLLVEAACDCAHLALRFIKKGELRPRQAIATARAWCRGKATIEQVRSAYAAAAAYAAAHAYDTAAHAAADAAFAADAYDADAAAFAAAAAAYAAAHAYDTAADAAFAADAFAAAAAAYAAAAAFTAAADAADAATYDAAAAYDAAAYDAVAARAKMELRCAVKVRARISLSVVLRAAKRSVS